MDRRHSQPSETKRPGSQQLEGDLALKNPIENPIYHARPKVQDTPAQAGDRQPAMGQGDGNGFFRNALGGWDEPITIDQMAKAEWVQKRYQEAIRKRWLLASELNQVRFFALSRYCKREGKTNPPGYFTKLLKKKEFCATIEDENAARNAIRENLPPDSWRGQQ
jgi:hypothetical protein